MSLMVMGRARPGGIYYGWALVVALAVTETTSWGALYYAFTVFLRPMQADLGWSRVSMTGAFSLALLISGLVGVPVGRWLDRHGPRLLMTLGSGTAVLLVLAWALVDQLVTFYLVWAGLGAVMAAVLYGPAFWVVAAWFRRKRGRALTLLTFIAGFASVIYLPLAGWLVEALGWRGALVGLAAILAIGTVPLHALVLRRRPEDLGLLPDGEAATPDGTAGSVERSITARQALRGLTFWLLTGAFFFSTLGIVVVFVHFVPYLTDRGYSAGFAATMTGLVGVMALPGRVVLTPLGDRVPGSLVTAVIFLLQASALAALLLLPGVAGVLTFVLLFGAGFGAVTPARAALVADYYGAASYGSISGLMGLFLTGASAAAPLGAGLLHDLLGGYAPVFWALAVVSVISAGAVVLAERSGRPMSLGTARQSAAVT